MKKTMVFRSVSLTSNKYLIAFLSILLLWLLPGALAAPVNTSHALASPIFIDSGQSLEILVGGNNSRDVALGDLDGNGTIDAVVAQGGSLDPQPNTIWLNDGAANFSLSLQLLGFGESSSIALDDLDGDNDLDVFVANSGSGADGDDQVWINQGGVQGGTTGVFSNTQTLNNGRSQVVVLGDLDGDTDVDALVSGAVHQIWWNDGNGSFSAGPTLGFSTAYDVALGDLDNDDDLDVVFAGEGDFNPSQVYWNEWDTIQEFTAGPELATDGTNSGVALAADLDKNPRLDIYLATSGGNVVWWNNGDDTFTAGSPMGSKSDTDVALAKLDGDRYVDAFVTRKLLSDNANGVWLNNVNRSFQASSDKMGVFSSLSVALADLDGDDDVDAFVANSGPNKVWLNNTFGPALERPGLFKAIAQPFDDGLGEDVALGDLDGDGDLDAFVVGSDAQVWLNGEGVNPPGTFSFGQDLGTKFAKSVALGDLDGDDDLDAFLVKEYGYMVWLNGQGADPPGVFSRGQDVAQHDQYYEDVALDDLDGDGDLDAFVVRLFGIEVWLNGEGGDPMGLFSLAQEFDIEKLSMVSGALGDLDGDGDVDAFVVGGKMRVLLNGEGGNSQGVFNLSQEGNVLTQGGKGVALGDLDGDGDLDAFEASYPSNRIWINGLLGNVGTFTDSGQQFGVTNSTDVALGDLDGDGDLDAFISTGSSNSRSQSNKIWENPGGGVNLDTQCLGSAASNGVALGDLDGDGDLDAFVANWGEDVVWINGQGRFCSCIVAWLFEENEPTIKARSSTSRRNLFSLKSLVAELDTFLDIRDELLGQTFTGRRYARLFDTHNAEIFSLLFGNAALRDEGLATLLLWQPSLQTMLDGQGDTVTISAAQVQAVDDFLTSLSAAASPGLQKVITEERAKLPLPVDFVNMTLDEAQEILLFGADIYLPFIPRS